jgi:hypothetical protein
MGCRIALLVVAVAVAAVALGSAVAAQSPARIPPRCTSSDVTVAHLILRDHYTLACGPGWAVVRANGVAYRLNGSKCFGGGRLNFGRSGPASLPPTNGLYLVLDPPSTAGSVDVIDGGFTLATSRGRLHAAISGKARVGAGLKRGTFVIVGRSDSGNGMRLTGSYYCGSNVPDG